MATTYWSPNQAAVAQVVTYTFTVPNGAGNTYNATINGKTVTYIANSTDGLTAAAAATGLFNLLNASTSVPLELTEIQFENSASGEITATARTPGVPFANVTVNGVSGQGLVLTTGNGLANGITTTNTTASASPSDVFDSQNWLRSIPPAAPTRSLPQNGDDVVVANTSVPMLWNLDRLAAVEFNTYTRWQSMTGDIGLPENNPTGYNEWRATYFKFSGPPGSVPAGGLQMVLGQGLSGSGPSRERYNAGSSPVTLTAIAAGSPQDEFGIRFLGVHTANTFKITNGVSLGVAALTGEISSLASCMADGGCVLGIGEGVTWTAGSTLTMNGGNVQLNSAPAALALNNGARATILEDSLTWAAITAKGGSQVSMLAGGTITALTLETGSSLDKSQDGRALTITNSTIDGDSCFVADPLNAITWTNATSVKQSVPSGPFQFTGTRTIKVT